MEDPKRLKNENYREIMARFTCKWTDRYLSQKVFFFYISLVLSQFLNNVVFQDQSKDYIGEDDITDMTELILF